MIFFSIFPLSFFLCNVLGVGYYGLHEVQNLENSLYLRVLCIIVDVVMRAGSTGTGLLTVDQDKSVVRFLNFVDRT